MMGIRKDKNTSAEHEEVKQNDIPDFSLPSEKEMAAANLRVLMSKLDGEDKCVACHAAKLLEQKESNSFHNDGFWAVLIFLLIFGYTGSNNQIFSSDFMDIYLKYLQDKENSADETFKV